MKRRLVTILILLLALFGTRGARAAVPFLVSGPDTLERVLNSARNHPAVPDGAGGMFVTWQARNWPPPCRLCPPPDTFHVWVQHVRPTGEPAVGWPADGVRVTTRRTGEQQPVIALDGAGGVFVVWRDERDSSAPRMYAQRLDASGQIAPGWPTDGVQLSGQGFDTGGLLCSDGAGGALVVWLAGAGQTLFAQHISGAGAIVAGWPAAGRVLRQLPGQVVSFDMCPDGAGGIVLAWEDTRSGFSSDVYALRVTGAGAIAPGWTTNGTLLSADLGLQRTPSIVPDGTGGAIVAWMDQRNDASDIYGQHLLADASVAPGWQAGGIPLGAGSGGQWFPFAASDADGGAFVAWMDDGQSGAPGMYVNRVTGPGVLATGWPTNGVAVSSPANFGGGLVELVSDGYHGAYVAWTYGSAISGQHLLASGATAPGWPAGGALVAAAASSLPSSGVGLVADPSGSAFIVWNDDRDVLARGNEVMGARVVSTPSAGGTFTPRTDPGVLLSVTSPSVGPLRITCTLSRGGGAGLELLDLSGRVLRSAPVEPTPGVAREVRLEAAGVRPGMYWVRLTQGGRFAVRRVVVLG